MDITRRILNHEQSSINQAYFKLLERNKSKSYRIYDDFVIGRDMSNDIILHDNFVSRRHSIIKHREGLFYIEDLDSQNGTFVNGVRIRDIQLQEGDQVRVGASNFLFTTEKPSSSPSTGMHSKNVQWDSKLEKVPRMAESDQSILLQGESGTGKEVISRYIHECSLRSSNNFVSINCSNFNQNLVESDLFGHKKGSFTDAQEERKGAFLQANGGTLLLDEIGDMPLDLQAKLLRALENKEIRPLGSDDTLKVDVRIIAASHKDLQQLVAEGKFRMDLYYRLNIIRVRIPALRERMEDFQNLLLGFAKESRIHFTQACVLKLQTYEWPGNIRELKNFVLRAKALFPHESICESHLTQLLDLEESDAVDLNFNENLPPVKRMEKKLIENALIQVAGNQRRAAKALGMPKSTLHDKIKRYKIKIETLVESL